MGRVIIAVGGTEEEEEGASSVGGKCGTAVYPQHGVPLPRANGLQPPHLSYERWGDAKKPFLILQAAFTKDLATVQSAKLIRSLLEQSK